MNKAFQVTITLAALVLANWLGGANAMATPAPDCRDLCANAQKVVDAVFAKQYPYDGCDQTFARCLAADPPHPLVVRLANYICRRAVTGQTEEEVTRSLERRALTMMRPGRTHEIDLTANPPKGDPTAKVQLVVYLCATCPFCSRILPRLVHEVEEGRLKGKVGLHVRPFPLRGHAVSNESALAITAAGRMGRFWEYFLHLYANFDALREDRLAGWAADIGLDRAKFEAEYKSDETRQGLVAARMEGRRNDITATPTFFLNGRRYQADMDIDTVVDIVLEELEALY